MDILERYDGSVDDTIDTPSSGAAADGMLKPRAGGVQGA